LSPDPRDPRGPGPSRQTAQEPGGADL